MVKVLLNNVVLADCAEPVTLEGNYYFPSDTVNKSYLTSSTTTTICPWKGTASYHTANVEGVVVKDVAWYYANPKDRAAKIKDHIAFYKNKVQIQD